MGLFIFFLLLIVFLALLIGAGSYSVRRYWAPIGAAVVESDDRYGTGVIVGVIAAVFAVLVLILLFFGLTQWNWFGTSSTASPVGPSVLAPGTVTQPTGSASGPRIAPSAPAPPS